MIKNFFKIDLSSLGNVLLFGIFYILIFLPILKAGYLSDDISNSLFSSFNAIYDSSLFEFLVNIQLDRSERYGRIDLLIAVPILFHYFFDNIFSYQLARVVFIFSSVAIFAWLIFLISRKKENGLLFMLLIPSLWLVQIFFDSLVSFDVMVILDAVFIGLTLCFFVKYQQNKSTMFFCLSLLCYVGALMVYEIGVLTLGIVIFLNYQNLKKEKSIGFFTKILHASFAKKVWIYLAIFALWISVILFLRLTSEEKNIYQGILFGDIKLIFTTFLTEIKVSLPLGSYMNFFDNYLLGIAEKINATILFFVAFILIRKFLPKIDLGKRWIDLGLIGLALFVGPAFIISLSSKYQQYAISKPNNAYLQVYFQYIGLALIFLLLSAKMLDFFSNRPQQKNILVIVFSLCFAWLISFVNYTNYKVVYARNIGERYYQRVLIQEALEYKILSKDDFYKNKKSSQSKVSAPRLISAKMWLNGDNSYESFEPPVSTKKELDDALENNPTIASSVDQILLPMFFPKYSDFLANLLKFDMNNPNPLPQNNEKLLIKKVSQDHELFLLEPGYDIAHDGYVLAAKLNAVEYKNIKSNPEILNYHISNPRIFFSKQYAKNSKAMTDEIKKRFNKPEVNIFLDRVDWSNLSKNSVIIELPKGDYHFANRAK